jgi:hypothetical protein
MNVDPNTMKLLADDHINEMRRMAQYARNEPGQAQRSSVRLGLLTLILLAFILL